MPDTSLLTRDAAAQWLAEQIGDKTASQWADWLRGNANHARRAAYRIPTMKAGRNTLYAQEELRLFVEFEKARRVGELKLTGRAAEAVWAFGVGAGGSTTGRPLNVTAINPQIGEDGTRFIQMIVSAPQLLVFRLDVAQAEAIARDLAEAAAYLKRGA